MVLLAQLERSKEYIQPPHSSYFSGWFQSATHNTHPYTPHQRTGVGCLVRFQESTKVFTWLAQDNIYIYHSIYIIGSLDSSVELTSFSNRLSGVYYRLQGFGCLPRLVHSKYIYSYIYYYIREIDRYIYILTMYLYGCGLGYICILKNRLGAI